MFPLVEFPELVQHYAPFFDGVFSAEAFIEFHRCCSSVMVPHLKESRPGSHPYELSHYVEHGLSSAPGPPIPLSETIGRPGIQLSRTTTGK